MFIILAADKKKASKKRQSHGPAQGHGFILKYGRDLRIKPGKIVHILRPLVIKGALASLEIGRGEKFSWVHED